MNRVLVSNADMLWYKLAVFQMCLVVDREGMAPVLNNSLNQEAFATTDEAMVVGGTARLHNSDSQATRARGNRISMESKGTDTAPSSDRSIKPSSSSRATSVCTFE